MDTSEGSVPPAVLAPPPPELADGYVGAPPEPPAQPEIFETIQRFGGMWPEAKTQKFHGTHPARVQLQLLDQQLKAAAPAEWTSKCSTGAGLWATIPWVAFFNAANSSIQFGLYVVYLFRADMSGVYLTIGQGVSRMMGALTRAQTDAKLKEISSMLQPKCLEVLPSSFQSSMAEGPIDLHAPKNCSLAKNYEKSTIAWAFYQVHCLLPATCMWLAVEAAAFQMDSDFSNQTIIADLLCCLDLVNQLQLSSDYFEMSAQLHDALLVGEEEKRLRISQKKKRKASQAIEGEVPGRLAATPR